MPAIPYLDLTMDSDGSVPDGPSRGLGLRGERRGRGCIMQLDEGFPKLDLTEFSGTEPREPLTNDDLGLVRICLVSRDLQADYDDFAARGIPFIAPPSPCHERLADVAVCRDPDGTLIELLQVHLERWAPLLARRT
jgi:hypothetical protein